MKLYIILGYLGSGKTTFLNSFIDQFKSQQNAVIVNDFGDDDVDGKLLERFSPKTVFGGSMFCSCKSDKFVEVALEISKRPFDNLIVEASGFSNPFTLFELINLINKTAENKISLGGVVTIVDATNVEKILTTLKMTKMQIAFADLILINKCDLVSTSDVERIEKVIKQLNQNARIEKVKNSKPSSYEIELIEKQLPQNVLDLTLQKVSLKLVGDFTKANLDELCQKLAVFSHRIKGDANIDNVNYVYQFANGQGTISKITSDSSNTLVLLSAEGNLKKQTVNVIVGYDFVELKE
ncbi:MAG: GTP-binding protein [Clostridia bacterium]